MPRPKIREKKYFSGKHHVKSYGRECLIDPNKFQYLVCGCIVFDCGRTYVRTYGRTYVRMNGQTFLPGLLGHLGRDDLRPKK